MTIHKEGYTSLAICILFIFVLNTLVQFFLPEMIWLRWMVYGISFLLFITILQFFRSPHIKVALSEKQIISPADGKVVVIEQTEETEYLKDRRIQVSIFMSPTNVHVNRTPMSGTVQYQKYHPGKFLVAWHPKSSTENERTTVVIQNKYGVPILLRQIAGALARRIVCYAKKGDQVTQGDEFGFIKFGSRVDIFLPLDAAVKVQLGEVVKGGISVIAEIPQPHNHQVNLS